MRTLLLLVLGGVCLFQSTPLFGQSLHNIQSVTVDGRYSNPVWSPDGSQLLLTTVKNDELFVLSLDKAGLVEKVKEGIGVGYKARWSEDGRGIVFRESIDGISRSRLKVKRLSLDSGQEEELPHLHPTQLKTVRGGINQRSESLNVYLNLETLKVEAKRGEDGEPWVITREEGQYYHPVVSHDGQFVVVHEGAEMYLYRVEGDAPRQLLGIGLASSWMPDNTGILTFQDVSIDGHDVSNSELYYVPVDNPRKLPLTRSVDKAEMWADVSADGKRIAFSDELSGQIFIANLEF